jgi:1-acyl-sn-glycerol-3-phosphate acyltransferase
MARRPAPERGELNGWWRAGVAFVGPLARLLFRLRFVDAERIPPRGAAILACNHISVMDGPLLALPPAKERGRSIRFLVAAEIFRAPVIGAVLRAFRQIPIRRGQSDVGALDEAIETIRSGALAGIFPEGRVNPGDPSSMQRVRRGVARMALASGAPVIPVGIWGTHMRWPRGRLRLAAPLRPVVAIAFGMPMTPSGSADRLQDVDVLTAEIADAIRDQVHRARLAAGSSAAGSFEPFGES